MTTKLPARSSIAEQTPEQRRDFELEELRVLDTRKADRQQIRSRLALQEFEDAKSRCFLLQRLARQQPQVESAKQMSAWADDLVGGSGFEEKTL